MSEMGEMTDTEVMASLAKQLLIERAKVAVMGKAIEDARMHLICIGGPLNDNKLGFNKEQLKLFFQIDRCLDVGA